MLWEFVYRLCLCFIFILSHDQQTVLVVPESVEMQCDIYFTHWHTTLILSRKKWYEDEDNDHYHCHQSALNEMWETRMHVNGMKDTSRPWREETESLRDKMQ